jgi:hypothetical protein
LNYTTGFFWILFWDRVFIWDSTKFAILLSPPVRNWDYRSEKSSSKSTLQCINLTCPLSKRYQHQRHPKNNTHPVSFKTQSEIQYPLKMNKQVKNATKALSYQKNRGSRCLKKLKQWFSFPTFLLRWGPNTWKKHKNL